jgi:hypothetical protein
MHRSSRNPNESEAFLVVAKLDFAQDGREITRSALRGQARLGTSLPGGDKLRRYRIGACMGFSAIPMPTIYPASNAPSSAP